MVNVFYSLNCNEVFILVGYIQLLLFDLNVDLVINYGVIGLIVGYEIGYGFDDQGFKFDVNGFL